MFSANVDYHNETGHTSGAYYGADTLKEARENLSRLVTYYTVDCPRTIDSAVIVEVCDHCKGAGEIVRHYKRNKFMVKRTTCPQCKGNPQKTLETWETH